MDVSIMVFHQIMELFTYWEHILEVFTQLIIKLSQSCTFYIYDIRTEPASIENVETTLQ